MLNMETESKQKGGRREWKKMACRQIPSCRLGEKGTLREYENSCALSPNLF